MNSYEKQIHQYYVNKQYSTYLKNVKKSINNISNSYLYYYVYNKVLNLDSLRIYNLFIDNGLFDISNSYNTNTLYKILLTNISMQNKIKFISHSSMKQLKYVIYENPDSTVIKYIQKYGRPKINFTYNYNCDNMNAIYFQFENHRNFFGLERIYTLLKKQIDFMASLDKKTKNIIKNHQNSWDTSNRDILNKTLDNIFESVPGLENEIMVFRGVGNMKNFATGSYISTTINSVIGLNYTQDECCLCVIYLPIGAKIIPFFFENDFLEEAEILLHKNSKFRSINNNGQKEYKYNKEVILNTEDGLKEQSRILNYSVNTKIFRLL